MGSTVAGTMPGLSPVRLTHTSPADLFGVVMFAPIAYIAARCARRIPGVGVTIASNAVIIAGPSKTQRLPSGDVEEFVANVAAITGLSG